MNTERPEKPEEPESSKATGSAEEPKPSRTGQDAEEPEASAGTADEAEVPGLAEPAESPDGSAPRRRSPLVLVSVAAAVLLAGGGGAYVAAGAGSDGRANAGASGGSATPPPLALDGVAAGGGTGGIAPGEPDPYGMTYVAAGPLPDGPAAAPVYGPGAEVGKAAVARLAKALGVDGPPVAEGSAWRVGAGRDGTGPSLQVNRDAPGAWSYTRFAPGTDDCRKVTLCAQDPGAPAAAPVSAAAAEKVAAPVLKALGQDGAKLDASQVMGARRVVNADPVVGGLPTYGVTTGLTVDEKGVLVGGHGQLAAPVKGDVYPVLSARRTLALMNRAPEGGHRMGIGGCTGPVPLKDRLEQPCDRTRAGSGRTPGAADEATVEKAVFGLAARSAGGRPLLVPSWLFEVRGPAARGTFTVAYPAVDPAYLASPSPSSSAPSGGPSSAPRTSGVKVDGYRADGRALTVSFTGGVCADYTASAKESAGRVAVTVTGTSRPGEVCVAMARFYEKTVRLDAPLGGRTVTGTDGTRIPKAKPGGLRPQHR
ncbi:hypothetical protein ACFW1F_33425 [Streptomyces bungoensis]|uniref:hypothetical protein n=1 Tax=Streptomyces bungoensis TaxID=285568 RepID=UPI00369FDB9A